MKSERGQELVSVCITFMLLALLILAVWFLIWPQMVAALEAAPAPDIAWPSQHALDRHGVLAVTAANCFNGGGTISGTMLRNPENNRHAWMCQMDDQMFVWITEETGETVTMFKNKAKTFEDAIRYLLNRGYVP